MVASIQNNGYKKPSKLLGISAIILGLIILALPLYFVLGVFQQTPNPAQSKAQPIINLVERLGGTKICQHSFNGMGNIDSNTPSYYAFFDVPASGDLSQQVITASGETGYIVTKFDQTAELYRITSSMHVIKADENSMGSIEYFSSLTSNELANSTLKDRLNIAIVHGTTIAPTICADRMLTPSSSNNAILAIDLTLWGK
ncbi:MAG: hypothetical protein JWN75_264 [Candidatus Saccharibacteria bacterium]|nr:hypothetical protein [Candidatus Saccharibacteria bacterium]